MFTKDKNSEIRFKKKWVDLTHIPYQTITEKKSTYDFLYVEKLYFYSK